MAKPRRIAIQAACRILGPTGSAGAAPVAVDSRAGIAAPTALALAPPREADCDPVPVPVAALDALPVPVPVRVPVPVAEPAAEPVPVPAPVPVPVPVPVSVAAPDPLPVESRLGPAGSAPGGGAGSRSGLSALSSKGGAPPRIREMLPHGDCETPHRPRCR